MQALNMESPLVAKEATKSRRTKKQMLAVVVVLMLVGGALVATSGEWRRSMALESEKANGLHSAFSTAKMNDQKLWNFPQVDEMLAKGDTKSKKAKLDPELLKEFHAEIRMHQVDQKSRTSLNMKGHIFKDGSKWRMEVTMIVTDANGVKWRFALDQLTRGGKVYTYSNVGRLKDSPNNKVTCHVSDEIKQPPALPLRYLGSAMLVNTHHAGLTGPRVVDIYQSKGKTFTEKIAYDAFGKFPVVSIRIEPLKVVLTAYKQVSSEVEKKNFVVPKHIPCTRIKQEAVGELDVSDLLSSVLF